MKEDREVQQGQNGEGDVAITWYVFSFCFHFYFAKFFSLVLTKSNYSNPTGTQTPARRWLARRTTEGMIGRTRKKTQSTSLGSLVSFFHFSFYILKASFQCNNTNTKLPNNTGASSMTRQQTRWNKQGGVH